MLFEPANLSDQKAKIIVVGVGGGGGGVTEWSLVMSEVRLQNTELRMSLARVRQR